MIPLCINWLLENAVGILGIAINTFIAYHVYFLSRRINLKDKLLHRDNLRQIVEKILYKINKGIRRKVELVNIKKYSTHYPHTNEENKDGYTYLAAELKALRFDGIEFFCGVKEVYRKTNGKLSLNNEEGSTREKFNIFEVGVIPYEWIEYIDPRGDEFSYRPQFFTSFKGLYKSPYKYVVYYQESDIYQEGSDPIDMKWRIMEVEQ